MFILILHTHFIEQSSTKTQPQWWDDALDGSEDPEFVQNNSVIICVNEQMREKLQFGKVFRFWPDSHLNGILMGHIFGHMANEMKLGFNKTNREAEGDHNQFSAGN